MNLVTILKRSNNLPVATDSHTLSFNSWKSAIIHGKKSKNMINETLEPIIMYKSTTCPHSWSVERWLKSKNINTTFINIDKEPGARAVVQSLNNGYASVPTLIFPDGTQLTEPSFRQLRHQLGIQSPTLSQRLKGLFGR